LSEIWPVKRGNLSVIRSCELKKTKNTMAKRKDRQYNGQKKGQKMQWPKGRTDNTMAKRKDRQFNG
jgi:hypothetical protein